MYSAPNFFLWPEAAFEYGDQGAVHDPGKSLSDSSQPAGTEQVGHRLPCSNPIAFVSIATVSLSADFLLILQQNSRFWLQSAAGSSVMARA